MFKLDSSIPDAIDYKVSSPNIINIVASAPDVVVITTNATYSGKAVLTVFLNNGTEILIAMNVTIVTEDETEDETEEGTEDEKELNNIRGVYKIYPSNSDGHFLTLDTKEGNLCLTSRTGYQYGDELWRIEVDSAGLYRIYFMYDSVMSGTEYAIIDNGTFASVQAITSGNKENSTWRLKKFSKFQNNGFYIQSVLDDKKYLSVENGEILISDTATVWEYIEWEFENHWDGWYSGLKKNEEDEYVIYYEIDTRLGGYVTEIEAAIDEWMFEFVGIKFEQASLYNPAMIRFEYTTEEIPMLAQAIPYNSNNSEADNNDMWSKVIIYIDSVNIRKYQSDFVKKTICHELGHALKIGHLNNIGTQSVMWSPDSVLTMDEMYTLPTWYDMLSLKQKLDSLDGGIQ